MRIRGHCDGAVGRGTGKGQAAVKGAGAQPELNPSGPLEHGAKAYLRIGIVLLPQGSGRVGGGPPSLPAARQGETLEKPRAADRDQHVFSEPASVGNRKAAPGTGKRYRARVRGWGQPASRRMPGRTVSRARLPPVRRFVRRRGQYLRGRWGSLLRWTCGKVKGLRR